jgi:hypothetical protein
LTAIGVLVAIAGAVMCLLFAFAYDPTVEATNPDYSQLTGHYLGEDRSRVVNLGREADRLIGIGSGLTLVLFGGLLILIDVAHGDLQRIAAAVEGTGKIVAEQDAAWRRKAETSETEERHDT